jgi:hypothetical protein
VQYVEISDPKAIRDAAALFTARLLQGAQTLRNAPDSEGESVVIWHPHLELWAQVNSTKLEADATWRRAPAGAICTCWSFGRADAAQPQAPTETLCDMSCLAKKFKRSREVVFLKDAEGQVWLGHRGLVKEVPKLGKQAKEVPLEHGRVFQPQDFPRVGPFGDARHPVMVIGRVEDEQFLERLAHFVHDMQHYRHGGPTGAERMEELRKSKSWTGRAMSFFKRK